MHIRNTSIYDASVVIFAAPNMPLKLKNPIKWLCNISSEDTEFMLLNLGFIPYRCELVTIRKSPKQQTSPLPLC